jgi:anthranilate synthase/indole-3-glycerol phosphate synthase/phosphoribosylanthranilate isomerase
MSILTTICSQRRLDVAAAKLVMSEEALRARISEVDREYGAPASLRVHLEQHARRQREIAVCAEFKRASPSKGDIAMGLDAAEQALLYATAGAAVVSVLTEPKWFKGSLDDLLAVRVAVAGFARANAETAEVRFGDPDSDPDSPRTPPTQAEIAGNHAALAARVAAIEAGGGGVCAERGDGRPRPLVLRKDFIIDAYQMLEARAYGADTALLIVSVLTDAELAELIAAARAVAMEPLVEVNTEEELERALSCGAKVIGVNNRNLHTFKVDLTTTERLAAIVAARGALVAFPPAADGVAVDDDAVVMVALSGIRTRRDALRFEQCGCSAILVGESLMRAADPSAALQALVRGDGRGRGVRVKVCGVRTPEAALAAAQAGVDFIGLIFAPASRRCVSVAQARAIVVAVETFRERDGVVKLGGPTVVAGAEAATTWFTEWAGALDAACDSNQSQPLCVGVFLDQDATEMNRIANAVGLDLMQLHGNESPETIAACVRPVIKVAHVEVDSESVAAETLPPAGASAAVLLDTKVQGILGGTGRTFDWPLAQRLSASTGRPFILAGGLTPDNVADAIEAGQPWGVDVASGVEGDDGQQDLAKIRAFVSNAKAARLRECE